MKYGLSEHQIDEIIHILSAYPAIEEAILFGSRATGTFKKASDIDLVINGKKVDGALAAKLKEHLEDETHLPFFFDVIAYPSITAESLKKQIHDYGIVLYHQARK